MDIYINDIFINDEPLHEFSLPRTRCASKRLVDPLAKEFAASLDILAQLDSDKIPLDEAIRRTSLLVRNSTLVNSAARLSVSTIGKNYPKLREAIVDEFAISAAELAADDAAMKMPSWQRPRDHWAFVPPAD